MTPSQFFSECRRRYRMWLVPTVVVGLLATFFALFRSPLWEATQALIVRDQAAASQEAPGKFRAPEDRKAVQETLLQLVTQPAVLRAALRTVGPPAGRRQTGGPWPQARDVESFRKAVRIAPPAGAEFGTTDVFYLSVRDHDRQRALALADALSDQLERRFQELRDAKAQSMVEELNKAVELARADLRDSTARLAEIETHVGSDLPELRVLNESVGGESTVRRMISEVEKEIRQAQLDQKINGQLREWLRDAQDHPDRWSVMPNQLLQSQPALRQLKEGLIAAQLHTAQLMGKLTEAHPQVQAARQAETQVIQELRRELSRAQAAVQVELDLGADRIQLLRQRHQALKDQLANLAGLRAEYANQLAETRTHTQLLEQAEQKLAEARMTQATAKAASLIARIDAPHTGVAPVGPSGLAIALAGALAGLLAGLGLIVLSTSPAETPSPEPTRPVGANARPATPNAPPETASVSVEEALQKLAPWQTWN